MDAGIQRIIFNPSEGRYHAGMSGRYRGVARAGDHQDGQGGSDRGGDGKVFLASLAFPKDCSYDKACRQYHCCENHSFHNMSSF